MLAALDYHIAPAPIAGGRRRLANGARVDGAEGDWTGLIVAVAERRDRAAFAQLFAYFAPRIKSYMLKSAAGGAEAEELTQEVMLLVWRKASLFTPEGHGAAAWIFTIARNVRIDAVRRQKRGGLKQVEDIEAEFQVDGEASADQRLAARQDEDRLRAALKTLPEEQKKVVELSFFEDRPHGEISEVLGLPLGTVKSRLRLAMERLRKSLGSVS